MAGVFLSASGISPLFICGSPAGNSRVSGYGCFVLTPNKPTGEKYLSQENPMKNLLLNDHNTSVSQENKTGVYLC